MTLSLGFAGEVEAQPGDFAVAEGQEHENKKSSSFSQMRQTSR